MAARSLCTAVHSGWTRAIELCMTVLVFSACTPDAPAKDSGTDSDDTADSGNPDDSGCVAEPPAEPCSETENYHLRSCGTCDSVWVCGGFGGTLTWGRSGTDCSCITADGGWDTGRADCNYE